MAFGDLLASVDVAARSILGGSVTCTPEVGSAVTVDGIFDAAYVLIDAGEAGVSSSGPAVFLTLDDLPGTPNTAWRVAVNGTTYQPHTIKPDGMGGVVLLLHEV